MCSVLHIMICYPCAKMSPWWGTSNGCGDSKWTLLDLLKAGVHDVTGSLHAKAAVRNKRYPKVSVVPRVGSFRAPYKHNNNAKQAHVCKLQLQNFTTCLICTRRVKIPIIWSCHVFLISADWSWTSEFYEANNFVVTCCKCLRHAKTHCQLHRWNSNYIQFL